MTFTFNPSEKSNAPAASLESGSVVARSTILELSAPQGGTVYYTTDGSDPGDTANTNVVIGNSLLLDGEYGSMITVKACVRQENKASSDVVTYTYQISKYQGGVASDTESGAEVSRGASINLLSDISNAVIYYTVDGTNPSMGSSSGASVVLNKEPGTIVTVKAMAIPSGLTLNSAGSTVAIFTYKMKETIPAPTASPAGGTLSSAITVTLSAAQGTVYYTVDNTEPSTNSIPYTDPIPVNKSMTIRAIAAAEEGDVSETAVFEYHAAMRAVTPKASVESGPVEPGTQMKLSSRTEHAVIYYPTDGTVPAENNLDSLLVYEEGITISRTVTILAAAYADGLQLSRPAEYQYEVAVVPAAAEREKKEKEEDKAMKETDATGLFDKRKMDAVKGTAFSGAKLSEEKCRTVVSAEEGVIPDGTKLVSREKVAEQAANDSVKALLGQEFEILRVYDMKLYCEGESVSPGGAVEIGIPIPEKYENASVVILFINSDGAVQKYDTRRSEGMAYAVTDHFSLYAIAGVPQTEEKAFPVNFAQMVSVAVLGGAAFMAVQLIRRRKYKKSGKKEL